MWTDENAREAGDQAPSHRHDGPKQPEQLKVSSGQVMVIGGLMEERNSNNDRGIPGVSEVPWLGNAFKGVEKNNDPTELIIFIRATIVGSQGNTHAADKQIYEKFTQDPRPIAF